MDVNELQVRLLHAAKTKDQWKVVTSYPKKGEVCLEATTAAGATSFKIKIGDGTRPYCRNTGTPEEPVWDFTSDQVLPYFGTTVVTNGTVNVVNIASYTEGSFVKKKLAFYSLSLSSTTVEGVTTLSPVLSATPYMEIKEGTGIEFTTDETGTTKLLNINISSSYLNEAIASAINALNTPSPLNIAEWNSSTSTLSLYSLSETDGIIERSSAAVATIDLSSIAPVQDVQINSTSILSDGVADISVDGTYDSSTNKIATQTTVSNAINSLAGLETTVNTTSSTDVITTVSETNGVVSSTKKTLVEGNKIDINVPTTGTSTGDIIISHEDIDTTATDVASTITTDGSSTVGEKELDVITGLKVDAQGHITHIDKDVSTNLVAADIKGSVSITDDSAWIYRPTGGTISIGEDIAKVNGLEGNSCVWNQLVDSDTTSITIMSGRKYYTKIDGTAAVVSGAGSVVSVTGGVDIVIDLTLLGIDNLTTTAQVEAWLAQHVGLKPYYAYNPGEILSAKTLGFNTYGQNLLNPTTKKAKLVTYTDTTNSNKYTIKNIPDETTVTYTPYNTSISVDVTSLIENDTFDITNYGDGILELSTITDDTYVCIKWDGTKDDDIVPYEEHNYNFDVTKVYGRVNGAGEYVQCFPDGIQRVNNTSDKLSASEAVAYIGKRTYQSGDESDTSVLTDKTNTLYILTIPITYTNLIYSEDGGQTGTPLKKVLLTMNVNDWGTEEQVLPDYVDNNPTSVSANVVIEYKSNFKEAVLDTIDKVNNYKNPVRGANDAPQTTDKLAVYDSDSTVKSSEFEISNSAIDPEGTSNETTVPTVDAVVDYVEDVISTEVTVKDITTTDDDTSGNGGIRITSNDTTYDVHHAGITQTDTTKQATGEVITNVVTNVTVDSFGHIKGKEVISSDKLIAADIKAPVKQTDNSTWNHRITGGNISIGEDTAKIPVLKGNTIVWNQLAFNGNFATDSGVSLGDYSKNLVINKNVATVSQNYDGTAGQIGINCTVDTLISGHKIYISVDGKSTESGSLRISIAGSDTAKVNIPYSSVNNWQRGSGIITSPLNTTSVYLRMIGPIVDGDTASFKNLICNDLTLIFGAGNEPSTVEEFEKLFPNDYYEYNEGELISLFDNSKSFNIWDEEWENGYWNSSGWHESNNFFGAKNYIPVFPNTNYFWNCPANVRDVEFWDASKNYISKIGYSEGETSAVFTTPANCYYITFYLGSTYGTTYNHDICINISNPEYNGLYLPYGEPLPAGVKSIGFNQWDEEWERGSFNLETGEPTAYERNFRSKNHIYIVKGQTYYLKTTYDSFVCYYNAKGNYLGYNLISQGGGTFIPNSSTSYILFTIGAGGADYNHDICINISDPAKNGTYEPYKQDTLDLSWIKDIKDTNNNQLFPYGLLSAGSVYDEVTETKAIKRIGSVDLGSLTWTLRTYQSNAFFTTDGIADTIKKTVNGSDTNISLLCLKFNRIIGSGDAGSSGNYMAVSSNGTFAAADTDVYTTSTTGEMFKSAMQSVMLYYELATPIEIDIVPKKNMSYLVNDLGTETQLPVNPPTTTPITAPFVGTFEYKSNFKDTVIDLIDKVNNAVNPVKGINNTDQTVGKIAIYDSERTTHSSNYSASNATIVEGATGNDIILPAVETIVNYVNSKLSSALTYKGTVSEWADLPTSGQSTGDMYIADTTFTEGGVTYQAGDFFIWNGTGWDIVSGTTSVVNSNPTLNLDGGTYQVGTVDGVALQVTTPNLDYSSPTASGTSLEYIDTVSQSNGLLSATKKSIPTASDSQSGVVVLSTGIENTTTEDSKVPTAYDTLTNLNNRDVASGTITDNIATLSKRMLDEDSTSPTYESWINKTFYPETKFNAITDFSTAFSTNYPDLNTIESLGTTGFLKRTGNNTWILTDDTGKMKWLDETTNTYTYNAVSTNLEELGSYIHNYSGITTIEKAVLDNNNYGFRIDVPILSSNTATIGKVLKGTKTTGVNTLPIWEQLGIEELSELDNLGTDTGYLKRKAGATAGTYEWELSTPDSTTVATTRNDGTETTSSSTAGPGIKVTTNGVTAYHRVPFSAISNDDSTGANAVTIILNGNFS